MNGLGIEHKHPGLYAFCASQPLKLVWLQLKLKPLTVSCGISEVQLLAGLVWLSCPEDPCPPYSQHRSMARVYIQWCIHKKETISSEEHVVSATKDCICLFEVSWKNQAVSDSAKFGPPFCSHWYASYTHISYLQRRSFSPALICENDCLLFQSLLPVENNTTVEKGSKQGVDEPQ